MKTQYALLSHACYTLLDLIILKISDEEYGVHNSIRCGPYKKYAFNNFSIVACVIVAEVTFLPSISLQTIGRYTYRHRDSWDGFMKYAVEMGSGGMIYVPSFIKIGSGIQKLTEGTHIHTEIIMIT
jgi:hypothetical protein